MCVFYVSGEGDLIQVRVLFDDGELSWQDRRGVVAMRGRGTGAHAT